jgi:hypothetical protein
MVKERLHLRLPRRRARAGRARRQRGDLGAGAIGLLGAYTALQLCGASDVYVVGDVPERLEKAGEMGAVPIDFGPGGPGGADLGAELIQAADNGLIRNPECLRGWLGTSEDTSPADRIREGPGGDARGPARTRPVRLGPPEGVRISRISTNREAVRGHFGGFAAATPAWMAVNGSLQVTSSRPPFHDAASTIDSRNWPRARYSSWASAAISRSWLPASM